MELTLLDNTYSELKKIDIFKSLIWTIRYSSYGDFELYSALDLDLLSHIKPDYFLELVESDRHMIIEGIRMDSDVEEGSHMIISGRSLESLLTRRIVLNHTTLTGSLQDGIKKLIMENIINPIDPTRIVTNFIFKESLDPEILALTVDAQYHGEELYEAISNLCLTNNIGFKITLSETYQYVFELYEGEDRSYDQIVNPYMVFSPDFENLINSSYLESNAELKTMALVGGEGEGNAMKQTIVYSQDGVGTEFTRRETFIKADVSTNTDSGTLSESEYMKQLSEKGAVGLNEKKSIKEFEGLTDYAQMFLSGKGFSIGDKVQLENQFGIESKSQVSEIIYAQDDSGINIYPTFERIDDEGVRT